MKRSDKMNTVDLYWTPAYAGRVEERRNIRLLVCYSFSKEIPFLIYDDKMVRDIFPFDFHVCIDVTVHVKYEKKPFSSPFAASRYMNK